MTSRDDARPELPLDPDPFDTGPPATTGRRRRPLHIRPLHARPLHARPQAIALVAAGGVIGTSARYGLSVAVPTPAGHWPWSTFAVNLAGAFVLGALLEALARAGADDGWRRRARLLLGTGLCGSLTTYSTFAVEADLLVRDHAAGTALGYLAAGLTGGFAATVLGVAAASGHHRWRRARRPDGRATGGDRGQAA